jgi:hypothetical protein
VRAFARAEVALGPKARLRASVGWLDHGFRFPQPAASAAFDSGPASSSTSRTSASTSTCTRVALADALFLTAGGSLNRNTLDRATWKVDYWRDFATRTGWRARRRARHATPPPTPRHSGSPRLGSLSMGAPLRSLRDVRQRVAIDAPCLERDYPRRSAGQFSPKLAAVATLSRDATLRLSYGEGFRAPTLLDLYSRSVTLARPRARQ